MQVTVPSRPAVTSERYAHLEQDYLEAAMRKLSLPPDDAEVTGSTRAGRYTRRFLRPRPFPQCSARMGIRCSPFER